MHKPYIRIVNSKLTICIFIQNLVLSILQSIYQIKGIYQQVYLRTNVYYL